MKTPEERAAEWVDGMASFPRFDPMDVPEVEALVAGAIREAVEEAAPRWIPVGERLPPRRRPVLVFVTRCGFDNCDVDSWDNKWYEHYDGDISHWMPLPGPPDPAS